MAKKQHKPDYQIEKAILTKAKEEYIYTLGDGLVGFYAPEDRALELIHASIVMSKDGYAGYRETEFLLGVTPYYMSQTKSYKDSLAGWLDPAYTLTQYAIEYDMVNYMHLCNCISYQMNAAGRAIRLSKLLQQYGDTTADTKPVGKGMLYLSAALLEQYANYTLLNLDTIRKGLKDNINSFSTWYLQSRGGLLCGEETKYVVPRMDKFFKEDVLLQTNYYQPITNKYQSSKLDQEQKQVKQYAHMLSLLLKAAHKQDGTGAGADSE
jgi:hypothetical protein